MTNAQCPMPKQRNMGETPGAVVAVFATTSNDIVVANTATTAPKITAGGGCATIRNPKSVYAQACFEGWFFQSA